MPLFAAQGEKLLGGGVVEAEAVPVPHADHGRDGLRLGEVARLPVGDAEAADQARRAQCGEAITVVGDQLLPHTAQVDDVEAVAPS
ncbi:hypothetical protein [Streptomyces sp. NPDC057381]|uniref:hypothetical protein n=1 Tax=unclassified Streptomyces TaxID=2593676 RepID=UPI003634C32D